VFHDSDGAEWPLIRFLLDDPVYRETYRNHLANIVSHVFVAEQVNARLRLRRDLIAPYVLGREGEQPGYHLPHQPNRLRRGAAWQQRLDDRGDASSPDRFRKPCERLDDARLPARRRGVLQAARVEVLAARAGGARAYISLRRRSSNRTRPPDTSADSG
jgi:hypothetical protein